MSLACADTANRVVQKLNVGHVHSWERGGSRETRKIKVEVIQLLFTILGGRRRPFLLTQSTYVSYFYKKIVLDFDSIVCAFDGT